MDALHWVLFGFCILVFLMLMNFIRSGAKEIMFWVEESGYWYQKYCESRRIELEKNEDDGEEIEEYESFSHPRVESVDGNVIHVSFGGE